MVKSSSSDRSSKPTVGYYYAYMLSDVATGRHHYVGCTQDLAARLAKHNAGDVPHTSKFRPWDLDTAVAFRFKEKAFAFEAYLKIHSGRAFAALAGLAI